MSTKYFLYTLFLFPSGLLAQRIVDVDKFEGSALAFFQSVGGEPLSNTKFVRVVEGSPYFDEHWMKGSVIIEESEYRNVYLRVNLFETSLEFLAAKGEAMVCTQPIKRVVLNDSIKGSQYYFIHSSYLPEHPDAKKSWLLRLADGNAALYKLEKKNINEIRPYGSATTEQHIISTNLYFIYFSNSLVRVKKLSEIPDILTAKKPELLDYIKAKKLSSKNEKDMIQLINYFNTL